MCKGADRGGADRVGRCVVGLEEEEERDDVGRETEAAGRQADPECEENGRTAAGRQPDPECEGDGRTAAGKADIV